MTSSLIPHLHFFESFSEAIIITKEDGTLLLINPAFKVLTGISEENMSRSTIANLTRPNRPISWETEFTKTDKSIIPLRISAATIIFKDESKGNVYTLLDNSVIATLKMKIKEKEALALDAEYKLDEQSKELARLNQEFEQFAYAASHDMQEPLRMIASYIQLIKRSIEKGETDDIQDFMNYVLDGVRRIQLLINDLLLISRVSRKGNEFAEVDLNEVMQIVLTQLANKIKQNEATVVIGKMPKLCCDSSQILQLLQNLIDNAIKFKAPNRKPEVIISVEEKEHSYIFAVKDNGVGIESKFYERIFAIFQRLHSRSEFEGSGIGLAVCKKVVKRHGGEMWVESETGKGSTFYFTLKNNLAAI